ncbi:MAG: IclR family transcriptional regulator [Polaromonas sp.]|nr:IclR family transcriptional regulator [Polaromonas sp.]
MTEHRIPAVDRAIQLLDCLARAGKPLGLRELALALDVPRSTVYRLVNSLEAGLLVVKATEQAYVLGPGLKRLANAVPQGFDLVSVARPIVEALASQLQLGAKLSVLDAGDVLVVISAVSPTAYTVSTQVGRRFPLHAGAASKVIAAYLTADALSAALPARLEAHTPQTITAKAQLRAELHVVREAGYATDHGEYANGIEAIAAPVFGTVGECLAALSVPFFMDESQARRDQILASVRAAAARISAELGAPA